MRQTEPDEKKSKQRRPFFISYGIVLLIMLLLNAFLFPAMLGARVQAVDYGTFLNMLEKGELTTVQLEDEQIYFVDAEEKMYSTNAIPQDYTIVQRLDEAGVSFGRVYRKQGLLEYLLTNWLLPFLPPDQQEDGRRAGRAERHDVWRPVRGEAVRGGRQDGHPVQRRGRAGRGQGESAGDRGLPARSQEV